MDLHEEYFQRRNLDCPVIKYNDKSILILRAKEPGSVNPWLHISIDSLPENNHPNYYQFLVMASPVVYASADFSHFSFHHAKEVARERWEWDNYENNLLAWIDQHKNTYEAIPSSEAIHVSWEMFCTCFDSWIANWLPYRFLDQIHETFYGEKEKRRKHIQEVETHIKENYERVYVTWKNLRQTIESKNYADWLAQIVNHWGIA